MLSNDGRFSAGTQCWRHRKAGGGGSGGGGEGESQPTATGGGDGTPDAPPSYVEQQLEQVSELGDAARVSPLGEREDEESWARPLHNGAGTDAANRASGFGRSTDWQTQHQEATMSDEALTRALNML